MAWKRKRTSKRAMSKCKHKILERKDVHENFRDWEKLHDDLLQSIIEKLPLSDCFALTSVCKPWGSVATNYLNGCDRKVPCFVKRDQNEVVSRNSFNVLENSNFEMELPQAYGKFIFGSFKEWLFLAEKNNTFLDISLLNPFSGECITLPSSYIFYSSMFLSAAPNDDSCICLIVNVLGFAFWTPGATKWHEILLAYPKLMDALFFEGCFYLLCEDLGIVVISEKQIVGILKSGQGPGGHSVYDYTILLVKLPDCRFCNCHRHYLVESCGNILLVSRTFMKDDTEINETTAFDTYKLDFQKLAWLKVENLENRILFVGNCCSKSYRTTDLGERFAGNVYFINDDPYVTYNEWRYNDVRSTNDSDDWGVFCTQKPNHWPSIFREKAKRWAGVWMTAPISWCLNFEAESSLISIFTFLFVINLYN